VSTLAQPPVCSVTALADGQWERYNERVIFNAKIPGKPGAMWWEFLVSEAPSHSLAQGDSHVAALLRMNLGGKWYVAHTRSRNEKILARELTCLGIPNYLPLAQRMTRSPATRRVSRSWVPVFSGYIFFNGTDEQRYAALRTNRIAHVLDVPNQNQLVNELINVHQLLSTTDSFAVTDHLKVGEWGRIVLGPLSGAEGIVTHFANRLRLNMNVTILGQSVSIEVDREHVERIDPPPFAVQSLKSR
jgi:transcription termination/antitermination protein NusG